MNSSDSEASTVSPPGDFTPTIVPIGESTSIKIQSETEQCFRNRLKSLDPTLECELLKNTELDTQISKYIDIDTDYQSVINGFVTENVSEDSKILIVDYENVAWATYGAEFKASFSKPNIDPRNRNVLLPNVDKREIFFYRIATYLILNYALKNNFNKVFVVCKTQRSEDYFLGDFNTIKTSGEIVLTEPVGNINVIFNCKEIQTAITSTIQCASFRINSDFILSEHCDKVKCHRIKGSDDSIIAVLSVLIYNKIQVDKLGKIYIMSRDGKIFLDFANDQTYCIPFTLKITNLLNSSIIDDFVVNFTKRQFILPREITDGTFTKICVTQDFISEYYYGRSKQITGTRNYDVKNWYKRTGSEISNALVNSSNPNNDSIKIPYVDASGNVALNPSGRPYLDKTGNIVKFNDAPFLEYARYDPSIRSYKPTLNKDGKFFNKKGNPYTINVYEWQPYYEKYLKYKAKYNNLKKKFGL
jgi:hypothetical protein